MGPCSAGDKFCGVALSNENGCAGVQVKGFCPVAVTAPFGFGVDVLAADGGGGVQTATAGPKSPHLGWSVWWSVRTRRAKRAVICL